jgi:hypothetical protein
VIAPAALVGFDAWLARPDRPVVVGTGRAWTSLRGPHPQDVEVAGVVPVRGRLMFPLRRRTS